MILKSGFAAWFLTCVLLFLRQFKVAKQLQFI